MKRVTALLRTYGFDVLIVLAAVEMAAEVALRYGVPDGPTTPKWFAVPATALIVLPLLARRRFPFAAPIAVWVVAALLSFVDGRLVGFTTTASVAGLVAAFLLGNLPDRVQARVGLVVVLAGAATLMYNNPSHTLGELVVIPTMFLIGWLAGLALRQRAAQAEDAEERAARAEQERVTATASRSLRNVPESLASCTTSSRIRSASWCSRSALYGIGCRESLAEDKDALSDVENAGRSALAEMRRLLGAMHDGQRVELAPQPGLNSLDALVERVGPGWPSRSTPCSRRLRLATACYGSFAYRIGRRA